MFKTFIVGTLSTVSSIMTPLGGMSNPSAHDYQLVSTYKCQGSRPSFVLMRVEPAGETAITVSIRGQACDSSGAIVPVHFAVILPADLTDTAFLAKLPANASYVVGKIPSLPSSVETSSTRIKLTKGALTPEGVTPIRLEWLPNENGQVKHSPMTVWVQPTPAAGSASAYTPWTRVEFHELNRQFSASVTVSPEIPPTTRR